MKQGHIFKAFKLSFNHFSRQPQILVSRRSYFSLFKSEFSVPSRIVKTSNNEIVLQTYETQMQPRVESENHLRQLSQQSLRQRFKSNWKNTITLKHYGFGYYHPLVQRYSSDNNVSDRNQSQYLLDRKPLH